MRKNPRLLGDDHVKSVYAALSQSLQLENISEFPNTTTKTVLFIKSLYPGIKSVTSKFDTPNPDKANDLTLCLADSKLIGVNLFSIKKGGRIQPKNLGAKSFFTKYFLSDELQEMFNAAFDKHYFEFLKEIVDLKIGTHYITDQRELKKIVKKFFPKRFTDEINPFRRKFLYSLREIGFTLLKNFYNEKSGGFFHAFNVLFMTEDVNIITYYGKEDNDVSVEEFNPGTPQFNDIRLYKSGNDTVGIKFGEVALTLRFKFESGPTLSVKLAVSYDHFPVESEIESINSTTIQKMMNLINTHQYTENKNESNAIGKCHESLTYFYFLKEYPAISQVEADKCVELLENYYSRVTPQKLEKLYNSTSTIVPVIKEKLDQKYRSYNLESIDLVPDSYLSDRLDTGDIQLILRVSNDYITESISLKAVAKKNTKVTTKNPGIGTILGPTYFDIYDLNDFIQEVKSRFLEGELSHQDCKEIFSGRIGEILQNNASQKQLRTGIQNLLGKALMAITVYNENISYCKEHSEIDGQIKVYSKTPTAIQNTLTWHDDSEALSLRVKFSQRESKGWSSVKLTSEYKPDYSNE